MGADSCFYRESPLPAVSSLQGTDCSFKPGEQLRGFTNFDSAQQQAPSAISLSGPQPPGGGAEVNLFSARGHGAV